MIEITGLCEKAKENNVRLYIGEGESTAEGRMVCMRCERGQMRIERMISPFEMRYANIDTLSFYLETMIEETNKVGNR